MAKKIFIDTNPLIYLVGEQEPYYEKVLNFMAACINDDSYFYTSTITDAEFFVKPIGENNFEQVDAYKAQLKKLGFYKCVVTEQVAEKSAELRAKYKDIKLADALQLAAAIEYGCDAFFTNDKQLKQVSEINVVYLSDL